MASSSTPRIQAFLSAAAVAKGKAVKMGADRKHVVVGAANTDRCVGILQETTTAAEHTAEVALPGGGAKGLLGESVTAGCDLCSHTDGSLVKVNAEGDQIIARALEDGSSGDLIAVEVYYATAHAAQ
jgi:hypothetical protein